MARQQPAGQLQQQQHCVWRPGRRRGGRGRLVDPPVGRRLEPRWRGRGGGLACACAPLRRRCHQQRSPLPLHGLLPGLRHPGGADSAPGPAAQGAAGRLGQRRWRRQRRWPRCWRAGRRLGRRAAGSRCGCRRRRAQSTCWAGEGQATGPPAAPVGAMQRLAVVCIACCVPTWLGRSLASWLAAVFWRQQGVEWGLCSPRLLGGVALVSLGAAAVFSCGACTPSPHPPPHPPPPPCPSNAPSPGRAGGLRGCSVWWGPAGQWARHPAHK